MSLAMKKLPKTKSEFERWIMESIEKDRIFLKKLESRSKGASKNSKASVNSVSPRLVKKMISDDIKGLEKFLEKVRGEK